MFDRTVAQAMYSKAGTAVVIGQIVKGLKALHQASIIDKISLKIAYI